MAEVVVLSVYDTEPLSIGIWLRTRGLLSPVAAVLTEAGESGASFSAYALPVGVVGLGAVGIVGVVGLVGGMGLCGLIGARSTRGPSICCAWVCCMLAPGVGDSGDMGPFMRLGGRGGSDCLGRRPTLYPCTGHGPPPSTFAALRASRAAYPPVPGTKPPAPNPRRSVFVGVTGALTVPDGREELEGGGVSRCEESTCGRILVVSATRSMESSAVSKGCMPGVHGGRGGSLAGRGVRRGAGLL